MEALTPPSANDLDLTHHGVPPIPVDPTRAVYRAVEQRVNLPIAGTG
jgi:hypothetical protein